MGSLCGKDLPLHPSRTEPPGQHHPVHALEGVPRLCVLIRGRLLRLHLRQAIEARKHSRFSERCGECPVTFRRTPSSRASTSVHNDSGANAAAAVETAAASATTTTTTIRNYATSNNHSESSSSSNNDAGTTTSTNKTGTTSTTTSAKQQQQQQHRQQEQQRQQHRHNINNNNDTKESNSNTRNSTRTEDNVPLSRTPQPR